MNQYYDYDDGSMWEVDEASKAIESTANETQSKKRTKRTDDELLSDLENQIKSVEERKKRLNERKKEIVKRQKEKERKERTRILIELGGDIAKVFPNEYKNIDHDEFIKYLNQYKKYISGRCIRE